MQLIQETQIRSAVTLASARRAVHDAFCALAAGDVLAPDELAMKLDHGGELHIKGAYLGGEFIAFKSATGQFPTGGNAGFTAVLDASSGAPVAILQDGGWLTEIRTAAAAAVTAEALARPDSTVLAILGGGYQAAFQVAAMRDLFDLSVVRSWSRSPETRDRFAAENDTLPAATVAEAVTDADIVICCTPSREPLVSKSMIKAGTHIIAMGADMEGKRELAADLVEAADLYVSDSVDVTKRVGELQHASSVVVDSALNLGDVLTGNSPSRTSESQITIADLCGLGIQDAAMAELVMNGLA